MIEGIIQFDDMLSAQKTHVFASKAFWTSVAVAVLALALSAWIVYFEDPGALPFFGWIWLVVLLLVPLRVFVFRWRARKDYGQRKDLHRQIAFAVADGGLDVQTENANAFKAWSDFHRWREGDRAFLLYISDNMYYVVPKHFFASADEIASFRATLRSSIRGA